MKKYTAGLNGSSKLINIELIEENKALINGKSNDYEHKFINEKELFVRFGNKNYLVSIDENEEGILEVNLTSKIFKIICKSELDLQIEKMTNNKGVDKIKNEIKSPMPGIITKLNVSKGQKVVKGDVLLVLEAMKMENEIRALRECVIKDVQVVALSSVEKNQLLIVLE